jgi:predicted nucleotidyltransferase
MVKGHNSADDILAFLLSNRGKEFTIRAVAKRLSVDYKTAYMTIQSLIKDGVILAKKAGQTVLCSINERAFNPDIFRAETIRRKRLLTKKDLAVLCSYLDDIREPFFILLVFGSYASGKTVKGSDIDIMLITDDAAILKKVRNKLSLIPLDVHLSNFSSNEFLSMLKTTDFNVAKEAARDGVVLFGIEDYYRLIKNA